MAIDFRNVWMTDHPTAGLPTGKTVIDHLYNAATNFPSAVAAQARDLARARADSSRAVPADVPALRWATENRDVFVDVRASQSILRRP
jgi:hypothetical protein